MGKKIFFNVVFTVIVMSLVACSNSKEITGLTTGAEFSQELDKITIALDKKSELPEGIGYSIKLKNGSPYIIKQNIVFVSLPINRGSITASNQLKAVARINRLDIKPQEEILINAFIPAEDYKDNKYLDIKHPQFEIEGYLNEIKAENYFTRSGMLNQ